MSQRDIAGRQGSDLLHTLNNILEYTLGQKGEIITVLRAVTEGYVKAITSKGKEIYFPLELIPARRGGKYRILSILWRKDKKKPVRWDERGQPVENADIVDDMRNGPREWVVTFSAASISAIKTKGRSW